MAGELYQALQMCCNVTNMLGCGGGGLPGPSDVRLRKFYANSSESWLRWDRRNVCKRPTSRIRISDSHTSGSNTRCGRRSVLICSQQPPVPWLDSLSVRPSECHQYFHAAVQAGLLCVCEAGNADNLLAELPFLPGTESAAETKTSVREGSSFKRKKTTSGLRHQVRDCAAA